MQRLFATLCLVTAGAVMPLHALAHVLLTERVFEAGRNFAAFFRVDEGCASSPTVALEVSIPASVIVLELPEKPGWTVRASRVPLLPPLPTERGLITERVTTVIWRGRLDTNAVDQFGLFVKLPASAGPLYFPAIQRCEHGEARWTDTPVNDRGSGALRHPAPVLNLVPVKDSGTHENAGQEPAHDHH